MAIEKVGVYRKWLGTVPKYKNGRQVPRSKWRWFRRCRWVARWYCTEGTKRYGKVFETRKEAESYAVKLQPRVSLGRADKPENITLRQFRLEHKEVMKGQVAHATLEDQKRALRLFEKFIGGETLLSSIKPRHAEAFISRRLSTGLSDATVNKDLRTLRRVFNLAIEPRNYLQEGQNPFGKLKQRKMSRNAIRYVTPKEYHKLMDAAEDPWWQALIAVAYCGGLRRGEILHLTWADVDFENHRIYVQAKRQTSGLLEWEPKDHENRVVPMSDQAELLLVRMQSEAKEGHPYVFISAERLVRLKHRQEEGAFDPRSEIINNLRRDFHAIRLRAGVARCTLHDLRRSAITNWGKKLPIHVVQQLAGHSDMKTTRQYYLAVRPEDLQSASEVLNEILAKARSD
jgi:integrase